MRVKMFLSSAGKAPAFLLCVLMMLGAVSSRAETTLVAANAVWRYGGIEQVAVGNDWRSPSFNDTAWKSGPAQLGYGDGDEATLIEGRPSVVFFRKSFAVEAPSAISRLYVRLLRDDGAVVYLNGDEVLRSNMPDGPVAGHTLALTAVGGTDESTFHTFEIPVSNLITGQNVLAVEVHQVNVSSSDLSFALELVGSTGELPPRPTVSIVATQPNAHESDGSPYSGRPAPGSFTIKRTGSLDAALPVYLRYEGSATRGRDYNELPLRVEIPAGQESTSLSVWATDDYVQEPTETVIALISRPQTSPDSVPYNTDAAAGSATLSIIDSQSGIEITKPANGANFTQGATIAIEAVAVAIGGTIERVNFYAGQTLIGTSAPIFINPPEPGQPINHRIEWKNAPVGAHVLTARGAANYFEGTGSTFTSQNVIVRVVGNATLPVLSIDAKWATTSEPLPNALVTPGLFVIRRSGETNSAFTAYFGLGGSAIEGVDYNEVANSVRFEFGQTEAEVKILPKSDALVEGDETVVAELMQPPTAGPAMTYSIDPNRSRAVVTIKDEDQPSFADIVITWPTNGTTLRAGADVTVEATAVDPDGYIPRVEFFVDGRSIGVSEIVFVTAPEPGTPIHHSIVWTNIPIGEHTLRAEAILPNGAQVVSEPVVVHVLHGDPPPPGPTVRLVQPANGAVFALGQAIVIEALATNDIVKLEILVDGKVIDSTDQLHLVVESSQAGLGEHVITARAVGPAGQVAETRVKVLVREHNAEAFVMRKLPPAYSPGAALLVELRAEPPDGGRAYAVEDEPPSGWTVSRISHEGHFDAATGKVKFGPFTDSVARTLSYRVTPPTGTTGSHEFAGVGSIDGVTYRIGGDRLIRAGETHHPADTNSDFRITVNELTAYAAEWKRGGVIPLSYVTRAGYIWKNGEVYRFEASQEAPFCWVPTDGAVIARLAAASTVQCERLGGGETHAGVSSSIQVKITPAAGTSAYAVEEKVPVGWTVSNISHEGAFDAATGTVRWGMFVDATTRTLSYTLTPPPNVVAVARFGGRASFDGAVQEVAGSGTMVSSDDSKLPTLTKCETDTTGKLRLELTGAAGQVAVLQSSTNLIHWQDVATVYLPDGVVQFEDNAEAGARYYRLQVR